MSIPFQYREEACYRFISSGFKLEETTAWMMKQWKDDPTIVRAKYPETLCANTITMGGNGDQKQLNVAAFGNAYRRYASETAAQQSEASRVEVEQLQEGYREVQQQLEGRNREVRDAQARIAQLLSSINQLEREKIIYQLRAGVEPAELASIDGAAQPN